MDRVHHVPDLRDVVRVDREQPFFEGERGAAGADPFKERQQCLLVAINAQQGDLRTFYPAESVIQRAEGRVDPGVVLAPGLRERATKRRDPGIGIGVAG